MKKELLLQEERIDKRLTDLKKDIDTRFSEFKEIMDQQKAMIEQQCLILTRLTFIAEGLNKKMDELSLKQKKLSDTSSSADNKEDKNASNPTLFK